MPKNFSTESLIEWAAHWVPDNNRARFAEALSQELARSFEPYRLLVRFLREIPPQHIPPDLYEAAQRETADMVCRNCGNVVDNGDHYFRDGESGERNHWICAP